MNCTDTNYYKEAAAKLKEYNKLFLIEKLTRYCDRLDKKKRLLLIPNISTGIGKPIISMQEEYKYLRQSNLFNSSIRMEFTPITVAII